VDLKKFLRPRILDKQSRHQVFLGTVILILAFNIVFLGYTYYTAKKNLDTTLNMRGEEIKTNYKIFRDLKTKGLLQLSLFVKSHPMVNKTFIQGHNAVNAEGGGPGEEIASKYRQQLYELLFDSWMSLSKEYKIKVFHFHLGPQATSFLRMHLPESFGDDLSGVRHIVNDTLKHDKLSMGIETGRFGTSTRGILPLSMGSKLRGDYQTIGAVEMGLDLSDIIEDLKKETKHDYAIVLRSDHLKDALNDEFFRKRYKKLPEIKGLLRESETDPTIGYFLDYLDKDTIESTTDVKTVLIKSYMNHYAVTIFPLLTYQQQQSKSQTPAGYIFAWKNANQEMNAFYKDLWRPAALSLAAFLIILYVLYLAIFKGQQALEGIVKQQTKDLEKLNDKLTAKNKSLDSYNRMVAHDLKTPLNSIAGYSELLKYQCEEIECPPEMKEFIQYIEKNAHAMAKLIESILQLAKHNMENLNLEAIDVTSVLADARGNIGIDLAKRNGKITLPTEPVFVKGDRELLNNVFTNMFSNAIKYTREGVKPEIAVSIDHDHEKKEINVRIKDNGIGIARDKLEEIFKEFSRVHDPKAVDVQGHGIGLANVLNIIRGHHAKINVDSMVGVGTTFIISFPEEIEKKSEEEPVEEQKSAS
jgi:signal transduction histidine kinase